MYWSVRARKEERTSPLPGDELLPNATASITHAITIRRPRSYVWPWLIQMGAGRAGWYSYDFMDNGGIHSAEVIMPELQSVAVGGLFPALPGEMQGFRVLSVSPERSLVLGWIPAEGASPVVIWSFTLEEPIVGITRLIVRARIASGYAPPFGLPEWMLRNVVMLSHFLMQQKQLLGIARRAESHH
jgi:hypothetical protein